MSAQSVSDLYFEQKTIQTVQSPNSVQTSSAQQWLSECSDKTNSALRKRSIQYIYIYISIYLSIQHVCAQCALLPLQLTGVEFPQSRASVENSLLGETIWQCCSWKRSIRVKTHSFLKWDTNSSEERYLVSTSAQFTLVPTLLSLSIPFATSPARKGISVLRALFSCLFRT